MFSEPSTTLDSEWEYRDFVFSEWPADSTWACLSTKPNLAQRAASDHIWQSAQQSIVGAIQQWELAGWEPIEPPGPPSVRLVLHEYTAPRFDVADVILWVMTLGLAFVFRQRTAHRTYLVYTPVEVRVPMRRKNAGNVPSEASAWTWYYDAFSR